MSLASFKERVGKHAGLALASVYFASLVASARSIGFGRDESFYFSAARAYAGWFRQLLTSPAVAFTRGAVDAGWNYNHEHPPLAKALFAFSWMLTEGGKRLGVDESLSFRLPAMLLAAMLVWLTHRMARELYGDRAAFFAAALLACIPRLFFHAHLACFDIPIAAMWTLAVYMFVRALRAPTLPHTLGLALVCGLTLATKHNAWMLPAVFAPPLLLRLATSDAATRARLMGTAFCTVLLAPVIAIAAWPWLWFDTLPRIQEYVGFHMHHDYYNVEYFGRNINAAPSPFGYAFVLTAATVPSVTLLLWGLGVVRLAGSWWGDVRAYGARFFAREQRFAELVYLLAFAVPYAAFMVPSTPVFGGTKHWMTAYPFLAIAAGYGADWCVVHVFKIRWFRRQRFAFAALAACLLAAPLAETSHARDFGLSNYVPLIGGTEGGANLGFHRQFWGFTTQSLAPYFEADRARGSVFIHDTTQGAFTQMQAEGRLPKALQPSNAPNHANYAIVHHELHMAEIEYNLWNAFNSPAPSYVLTHDGVPIISVWKRAKKQTGESIKE